MSRVFADTSALYALLDTDDAAHQRSKRAFARLESERAALITSSFVVLECCTLIHVRLGMTAVRDWRAALLPLLDVMWVDRPLHDRALAALLAANRREVSLTDWCSFELMRDSGIERVFAFDKHFKEQGFSPVA